MLNAESRLVRLLIWLATLLIVAAFLWTFFGWAPPLVLLSRLIDSEPVNFIARNQMALIGLGGIGSAILAYLWNGWRDRAERRHAIERAERRQAEVLLREANELGAICAAAARRLLGRGDGASGALAELRGAAAAESKLLLSVPAGQIARLGAGVSAAIRAVRAAVRQLREAIEAARDDAAALRLIATRAIETAHAAHDAARVLATHVELGPAAADRLRPTPLPEPREIEAALGLAGAEVTAKPSRLHSAA